MLNSRHTLATILVAAAAALVPASAIRASNDITDTVRQLASDGADLVIEEQALLADTAPASATPLSELEAVRAQLRSVDAQGRSVLDQLERLDIELTGAILVALDRLPTLDASEGQEPALQPPPGVVYEAAAADLLRISATPEVVTPSIDHQQHPAVSLLVVAVLALLVLGAFALGSTMRHRRTSKELAAMAWSDGLTGLANRRRLDFDLLPGSIGCDPTAVIMVDVDHFKSVNDSFGHKKGDEVLRVIGIMLANQIRFEDVVYRYGGEEFCILLPNSSTDDARQIADRILRAARQITLPDGQHVTVSVGIAASVKGDVGTAVESADHALFEAKDLGRDQMVTAAQANLVES